MVAGFLGTLLVLAIYYLLEKAIQSRRGRYTDIMEVRRQWRADNDALTECYEKEKKKLEVKFQNAVENLRTAIRENVSLRDEAGNMRDEADSLRSRIETLTAHNSAQLKSRTDTKWKLDGLESQLNQSLACLKNVYRLLIAEGQDIDLANPNVNDTEGIPF